MSGASDTAIIERAIELDAVILTTDRDYFHTLHHEYPQHGGLIVIAIRQPSRTAILNRLKWFIEHVPESAWQGRAFQLRDTTWLARPPLSES
jgi:hypothetical protein